MVSTGSTNDLSEHGRRTDEEAQLIPVEGSDFADNTAHISQDRGQYRTVCGWLLEPVNPQSQTIRPFIPRFQQAPLLFLERHLARRGRRIAFCVFALLWVIAFAVPVIQSGLPVRNAQGQETVNLDCIDTLWYRKNLCGIDGINCGPFSNTSFSFRCPANCLGVQVLNPRAVGPLDINYRPLVIGTSTYRGDSFICGAAIHSGLISNAKGGCGRLTYEGRQEVFLGSTAHGIESVGFDSYFPLSFSLASDAGNRCPSDPGALLLLISLFFTFALSIFTADPRLFLVVFIGIFAHVAFVSEPPMASHHNTSVLPDHISKFAERLLPALFGAAVLYWTTVRRVLDGLVAQYEKAILWLGGFWFGALSNYTFKNWIPIRRLTAHDLDQQPGAKLALAIIILLIFCIVIQQIYYFRLEGRLVQYLKIYGLFLGGIMTCLAIPNVELRLHHYAIALLLLPGTSMQTRPSLLYQGILLGLSVNGTARWGFDSILQTPNALRGDGAFGSILLVISNPLIALGGPESQISFMWMEPPQLFDGISVLVNDVARYRHYFADAGLGNFTWSRSVNLGLPEYFRFAYIKEGVALDYTKAGTWLANGSWNMMQPS